VFGHDPYPSLFEKAAYLLCFIIERHPFVDGNKRTAIAIAAYFLERNDTFWTYMARKDMRLQRRLGTAKSPFSNW